MSKRANPMKYFSGNAFARLPLYKLLAGGMAGVLCAGLGIGVMAARVPALPIFTDPEQADAYVLHAERGPLLGVQATVTLTDSEGTAADFPLDPETGTALAEDVKPGDYTLTVQPIEGYTLPDAQTVTVKEKVVYKADVAAVKDKIVQASQVNEKKEDSGASSGGSAPIAEEVTDTVAYAESSRESVGWSG